MKKTLLGLCTLTIIVFGGDFEEGMKEYQAKNDKKAVELWTKSANQGYAKAQYHLGLMYYNGLSVKQNYSKAVELYTKAANQEFTLAQFDLGFMYLMGRGVKQDKLKTYQLWMKADKQGYIVAQDNLDILCNENPEICKQ